MPAYELRSGGDVKNKKQSMADLKYRRLTELNSRLKEDLDRPRVKVSEAALSWVSLASLQLYNCHNTPPPTCMRLLIVWFVKTLIDSIF